MNFKKYVTLFWAVTLCAGFFSCDDDVDGEGSQPADTTITSDFFILNRGNHEANDASISYYDVASGMLNDKFYENANGSGLGDSAEDMFVYGSKIYVSVTTSNRLAVMDMSGKLLKAVEPKNEGGEPLRPRYLYDLFLWTLCRCAGYGFFGSGKGNTCRTLSGANSCF